MEREGRKVFLRKETFFFPTRAECVCVQAIYCGLYSPSYSYSSDLLKYVKKSAPLGNVYSYISTMHHHHCHEFVVFVCMCNVARGKRMLSLPIFDIYTVRNCILLTLVYVRFSATATHPTYLFNLNWIYAFSFQFQHIRASRVEGKASV